MTILPCNFDTDDNQPLPIGMIVLQTDETVEPEFKRYFSDDPTPMYVTRIPSGLEVTPDSLSEMQKHLPAAADLLPRARSYSVVGYGCTSASSIIGSEEVERLVQTTCDVKTVTNPLRAAVVCAAHLGISKLALLSPYIEDVTSICERDLPRMVCPQMFSGPLLSAKKRKLLESLRPRSSRPPFNWGVIQVLRGYS